MQLILAAVAFVCVYYFHQISIPRAYLMFVQIIVALLCLMLLRRRNMPWPLFSFVYWVSLAFLGQSYADAIVYMYGWPYISVTAAILTLWGIVYILSVELKINCRILRINTILGKASFLLGTLVFFFGVFGAAGFATVIPLANLLSWISWMMVPLCLQLFYKKLIF